MYCFNYRHGSLDALIFYFNQIICRCLKHIDTYWRKLISVIYRLSTEPGCSMICSGFCFAHNPLYRLQSAIHHRNEHSDFGHDSCRVSRISRSEPYKSDTIHLKLRCNTGPSFHLIVHIYRLWSEYAGILINFRGLNINIMNYLTKLGKHFFENLPFILLFFNQQTLDFIVVY